MTEERPAPGGLYHTGEERKEGTNSGNGGEPMTPPPLSLKFNDLTTHLRQFRMACSPSRESEIESALTVFLESWKYPVKRQTVIPDGRLDLAVGKYVIEVKLVGQKNIAAQLDRYSAYCDGLIVVCWRATQPLRVLFSAEKKTAKIPVELIEVRKACEMI